MQSSSKLFAVAVGVGISTAVSCGILTKTMDASSWLVRESDDDEGDDDGCRSYDDRCGGSGGGRPVSLSWLGIAPSVGGRQPKSKGSTGKGGSSSSSKESYNNSRRSGGSGEAGGSCAGATLQAATATGSCSSASNNRLAKQNRSNNSNSGKGGRASSSNRSYSKIFGQYLPDSLNLNYALNINRSNAANSNSSAGCSHTSGPEEELQPVVVGGGKGRLREQQQQPKVAKVASSCANGGQSQFSKSIVSVLSKFKLSTPSVNIKQASSRLDCRNPIIEEDPQQQTLTLGKQNHRNSCDQAVEDDEQLISCNNSMNSSLVGDDERLTTTLETSARPVPLRRKGFLYLRRSSHESSPPAAQKSRGINFSLSNSNSSSSALVATAQSIESRIKKSERPPRLGSTASSSQQQQSAYKQHVDLNNNCLTNLLGSSSNSQQRALRDAERTACLLEDDNDGQDYQSNDGQDYQSNDDQDNRRATNSTHSKKQEAPSSKAKHQLHMATRSSSSKGSGRRLLANGAELAGSHPSSSKMALAMGYLMGIVALGLFLLLSAAGCISSNSGLLVEALQQAPPPIPFSRSQQPSQSHLSSLAAQAAASQPLGGGGPQSPQSLSPASQGNGGGGGQRPVPQPAAGSLVANINCNKIRGHVTFTPNLQGGTTVTTQITAGPPGEVYQWSVHQFPVKPGAAMCTCSPMILGTKLIDLSEMHGNLPSDQEFNVQSSLSLFGIDSPVGHSLMLRGMKTGMVACATFLPTSRKSNYRAKFHTPLSGSVTIFQTAFGTSFISHLMYSNGTRRHSMHRFDLVRTEDDIVTMSLSSGGQNRAAATESLAQIEQREHEQELSQCRQLTNGEALFKNMTYQLAVSTENFGMRGRTSMVLPQIPFETFSSVYLVIYSEYDPSEPIACAPLRFVKPKTAAAKFQSVSVQGSVVFSQDSPYDVTVAKINLNLPNSDGHSYGIDELPMIVRRKSDTRTCPNIREIIYNPHHIEPSSVPPEGEATSDQYAVGDLSGKYGSLTGKANEKIQVNDYNLPLFGPISIVGRAMTIYSAEGVAIGCSNVEPTTPMTTAFATFDFGIQGQFIFRQPVNDCNGDTYVYIEVSKPVMSGGSSSAAAAVVNDVSRSLDHNWHIHVNPVDSGLDHLSTTDCSPAGPHFNPYNTSTSSIYSRDCTPFNVLRCELGDLSAKMFTIEIPPYKVRGGQEPEIGKFFGTDIDLPLCGPVSIVNRSVVVHVQDFGAQRLACSTVIEFKPR